MAINFPSSPTTNQTFTSGSTTWKWNGTAWVSSGGVITGVASITSASTITPSIIVEQYNVTALAVNATIAAPAAGSDGQKLMLRIEDNGTARTLTWTTTSGGYRAIGNTLPTTTVAGKVTYIGLIYNAQDTYWDVVANSTQV